MSNEKTPAAPEKTAKNRLLILVVTLALLVCAYLGQINNIFKSPENLNAFLQSAKTYSYTADIVKAEISDRLPQKIKDNFIQNALISKFMDFVITPDNVSKVAEPGLKVVYKVSQQPTEIVNNKVVVDTANYKSQASSYISGLKLSDVLNQSINELINSVPNQLTIVDLDKRPNSALAALIHARDYLKASHTAMVVSWWILALGLVLLLLINLRNFKRMFKSLSWGFGLAGGIIVIGSWVFPSLFSAFGPKSSDEVIGESLNGLINSIFYTYHSQLRNFGVVCLIIAVIAGLTYMFVPLQKFQDQVNAQLDKLHKKPKSNHPHHTHKEPEHHHTKAKSHKK